MKNLIIILASTLLFNCSKSCEEERDLLNQQYEQAYKKIKNRYDSNGVLIAGTKTRRENN